MRIAFIGGGNMASALIGGLLAAGRRADDLKVIDPSPTQRAALEAKFPIACFEAASDALDADVWVLAVKPQQMREAAAAVRPHLQGQLVVTVAAGIRASDLSRWLGGHRRIVRAMPNTPALIGAGVTGLARVADLPDADAATAEAILGAVGETVWVDDEEALDAVTAVSGSGPAYVFLFMELVQRAAEGLGLSPLQAQRLTTATFTGASRLAAQSSETVDVLRERVTSKGGTTAAALSVMQARRLSAIIDEALAAAARRSRELGDEFGAD